MSKLDERRRAILQRRRSTITTFGGSVIPSRSQLLFFSFVSNIGELITFQDGDATDFTHSTFSFIYAAETTGAVDVSMGGGVMFTGTTPISRTWQEWMDLAATNVDYLFIGIRGIAGYSADQTALASRIKSYLQAYDSTPAAITFTPQYDIEPSATDVTSNTVTITRIGLTTDISVVGGEYSINSGAWTSTAGTVVVFDEVQVRGDASADFETGATVSLTVGTVSGDFVFTTRVADTVPAAFSFTDVSDVEPNTETESDAITISDIEADVAFTVTGGTAEKNDSGTWAASGTVSNGDTVKVKRDSGTYESVVDVVFTAGGVSDTFSITARSQDIIPSAFSFTDATGAELSTEVESNAITVLGVDSDASVIASVTGGSYEVNDSGTWLTTASIVSLNDTIKVKVTSSDEYETAVSVVLDLNGVSDTFAVTTRKDVFLLDTFVDTAGTSIVDHIADVSDASAAWVISAGGPITITPSGSLKATGTGQNEAYNTTPAYSAHQRVRIRFTSGGSAVGPATRYQPNRACIASFVSGGNLYIHRRETNAAILAGPTSVPGYSTSKEYVLELITQFDEITANLYDNDVLVLSISATDDYTWAAGYAGIITAGGNSTIFEFSATCLDDSFIGITDLYASADGAYYDASDLSTLFQDVSGETAVTATGQSVRYIADSSGNGNDIVFSGSAPPTLQADSDGDYYLQPTSEESRGVCSGLVLADPLTFFALADITKDAVTRTIYDSYVDNGGCRLSTKTDRSAEAGGTAILPVRTYNGKSVYVHAARDSNSSFYANKVKIGPGTGTTAGIDGLSLFNKRGASASATDYDTSKLYKFGVVAGELTEARKQFVAEALLHSVDGYHNRYIYIIGDSTAASWLSQSMLVDFIDTRYIKRSIAIAGATIAAQKTTWLAELYEHRVYVEYAVVQLGLNDLAPAEAASVAIARLQDLIDTIPLSARFAKIVVSQMTPCKQRLIDIYGETDGATAYQKWLDINDAIAGNGAYAITGVDARVTAHVSQLSDGSGNLAAAYDTGDHIHTNDAGRAVNAAAITAVVDSL